jgi:hypothetical protein
MVPVAIYTKLFVARKYRNMTEQFDLPLSPRFVPSIQFRSEGKNEEKVKGNREIEKGTRTGDFP